jgi:hypothetical protein
VGLEQEREEGWREEGRKEMGGGEGEREGL